MTAPETGNLDPCEYAERHGIEGLGRHLEDRAAAMVDPREVLGDVEEQWGELLELPDTPIAPALAAELLPPAMAFVEDVSYRLQLPAEMVAAPAVVCASAMAARMHRVRVREGWELVPNLWGVAVKRPGMGGTPAMKAAIDPLQKIEAERVARHADRLHGMGAELELVELERKRLRSQAQKGNADSDLSLQLEDLNRQAARLEQEMQEPRIMTNDPTGAALAKLLAANPGGMLLICDEFAGLLTRLKTGSGREGDRAQYLEGFDGDSLLKQDRISRETQQARNCLSIYGTIQPGPFRELLSNGARGPGSGDDGFLQRLQVMVWPEQSTEFDPSSLDRAPDTRAAERWERALRRIHARTEPRVLTMSGGATSRLKDWTIELQREIRTPELQAKPAYCSHRSKYRSLMPSLAAIWALLEDAECVRGSDVDLAIRWCDFLDAHARKVYDHECGGLKPGAERLAQAISAGDVSDGCSLRDIYRHGWSGLKRARDVNDAADTLSGYGWCRLEERLGEEGGRPSVVIRLHPDLVRPY